MPVSQKKYYGSYYYGSMNAPMAKRPSNKKISEEEIRIQKEKDKQRAEAILKQNRAENNSKNTKSGNIYDFEKDNQNLNSRNRNQKNMMTQKL